MSQVHALRKSFRVGERDFIKKWDQFLKATGSAPDMSYDYDAMIKAFKELLDTAKVFDRLNRLKTPRVIKGQP